MSDLERLATEPMHFSAPPAKHAAPPFAEEATHRPGEINERRALTENPDALRRLRSL